MMCRLDIRTNSLKVISYAHKVELGMAAEETNCERVDGLVYTFKTT